jgi:hypothetical protein
MLLQALAMRGRFHQEPSSQRGVPGAARLERQTRPGSTLQRRGSIFIDVKVLEIGSRVFSGSVGLNKRETEPHSLGDGKQVLAAVETIPP